MSSSFTTYYDTLGVTPLASIEEVRRGYRRMAIKTHPDKNPHIPKEIAAKMFLLVTQAFEFLSDPERKRDYDELIELSREQQQAEVSHVVNKTTMELAIYYPMERAENLFRRFLATFGSGEGSPEMSPDKAPPELDWDYTLEPPRRGKMHALTGKPRNLQITRDPLPLKLTNFEHKDHEIIAGTQTKAEHDQAIETIRRLSIKTQKSFKNFLEKQGEEALKGRTRGKMYSWEKDPESIIDSDDEIFEGRMEEEVKREDDRPAIRERPRKSYPK